MAAAVREQRGGEHPVRTLVHGREERGAGVLRDVFHQVHQHVVEPVAVRGELGAAQGSAGVEDGDGFVRSRGGHAVGAHVRALGSQGQQVRALLLAGPEAEQHGGVDAAAGRVGGPLSEERVGDHGARPGLLDQRGEFAGPWLGRQEHDAAADEMDGELHQDGVHAVGQEQPHPVAGREPLPAQRMPQPEQLPPSFRPSQPLRPWTSASASSSLYQCSRMRSTYVRGSDVSCTLTITNTCNHAAHRPWPHGGRTSAIS